MKVSAKLSNSDRSVEVEYNFGETLAEAVELFGEEVVFSRFKAAAVVDLQALIRRGLTPKTDKEGNEIESAKTDEEIAASVAEWKPGVKQVTRKSKAEKIKDLVADMSDEDREALLASIMAGDDED